MKIFTVVLLFFCCLQITTAQKKDALREEMMEIYQVAMQAYQAADFDLSFSKFKLLAQMTLENNLDTLHASMLNGLGVVLQSKGDYEAAIKYQYKAKDALEKIYKKSDPRYVAAVNNIAVTYTYMEKFEEAEQLYLEVLSLWEKTLGKKHAKYATALNNFANLYQKIHRYEEARTLYLESKTIRYNLYGGKHELYAASLNNLGEVYRMLNNYHEAIPLLEEGLAIRLEILGELHPLTAQSLNNLALAYQGIQDFERAEQLYLKSLAIRAKKTGKESAAYAQSLNNLGTFYRATNQDSLALIFLEQSIQIRENKGQTAHSLYFNNLNNAIRCHSNLGNYKLAYENLLKVLAANAKTSIEGLSLTELLPQIPRIEWRSEKAVLYTLNNIIGVSKKQFKETQKVSFLEQAYTAVEVAIKMNEKKRNSFANSKNKLLYLKDLSALVLNGISLGEQLSAKNPALFLDRSFHFAEQNKSMLLAEALKGNRAIKLGDLPDSIALKETQLEYKLHQLQKQENGAKEDSIKAEFRSKINLVNLEITAFLKFLEKDYPKYHALKYENITAGVKDIQALLDEETLFLEYFLADSSSYLFAIGQSEATLYKLDINAVNLKVKVRGLRNQLSNYKSIVRNPKESYLQFTQKSEALYKSLLEQALASKNVKNLVIVADGELGHIPFGVFLLEPGSQDDYDYKKLHYLLNDYNISYNYSATLFAETSKEKSSARNAQILACAAHYPRLDSLTLSKKRTAQIVKSRLGLSDLPAAQKEVEMLGARYQGRVLIGEEVTEAFFKEYAPQYGVIHLAMHGIVHNRLPILSSLAFSENLDSLEDNFLQAYEIAHLKLNANLVVLSACETGYGKFEQGEGVLSLARSFMYAGVPSLVVSLWQVNDASTAMIMEAFYENLALGMTKDEALRQAKLDYMNSVTGLAAHPAFWSPFIQLGDNRSIAMVNKGFGSWLLYLGIGLCAFLGLFLIRRKAA